MNTVLKIKLTKIKHFKAPPNCIIITAEAVCLLFNILPSWKEFLKLIANGNAFLQSVIDFDFKAVSDSTMKKVKKYIEMPEFKPEDIDTYYSVTMGKISSWVIGVYEIALLEVHL
jgi:dynein heavy chain